MKRWFEGSIPLAVLLLTAPPAAASHPFTEEFDEDPCCALADAEHINREVPLSGAGPRYARDPLLDFLDDPVLPVSNGGDLELLWDNGALGFGGSLALTPDDEDGNYPFLGVEVQTAFAVVGDLPAAMPRAGVVARHTGPPGLGARKFYAAYGEVVDGGGVLKIRFRLEKWIGEGFVPLDSGPAVTGTFDFAPAENFRITLAVSEPDGDGGSELTATFARLRAVDGVLTAEPLDVLTGTDRDLRIGQVGIYAEAGSVHTQIAFDPAGVMLLAPVSVVPESWGRVKVRYR